MRLLSQPLPCLSPPARTSKLWVEGSGRALLLGCLGPCGMTKETSLCKMTISMIRLPLGKLRPDLWVDPDRDRPALTPQASRSTPDSGH